MEASLSGQSSSQSRFDTASDAGLLDLGARLKAASIARAIH
jgi:hypothetical protein